MNRIDLHTHSYLSDDGQYTVKELIDMAVENGVEVFSIADHNSVRANESAILLAEENGLKYITGIEIDCTYKDINLHVLGLGVDHRAEIFRTIEEEIYDQEISASQKRLQLTKDYGFEISKSVMDRLSGNGVYTGEMFAEAILADKRYLEHEELEKYRDNGGRADNPFVNFYWDYYAPGKPMYAEVVFRSLGDIIRIIHENGGLAVLAHPAKNLEGQFEVIDEMIAMGLDGIEAYSSYHDAESVEHFKNKALTNNLIYTAGSDFHGDTKPSIELGDISESLDENELMEMLKKVKLI